MKLRLENSNVKDFPYRIYWENDEVGVSLENAIKTITTGFCLGTSSTYLPVTIAERFSRVSWNF